MKSSSVQSINDILGSSSTRWVLSSALIAAVISMLVAGANLLISSQSSTQSQIEAAAKAFRTEVLSGEFKVTEMKIRSLLQLPDSAEVKILDPEMNEFFADGKRAKVWPKSLKHEPVLWNGIFSVSSVAPIFFDTNQIELFGYLAMKAKPQFNWFLFYSLFLTLIGSQIIFAFLYRSGVKKIGFQLSKQLKSLEHEILNGIAQPGTENIQEFAIISQSFKQIRSQIDSIQSSGKLQQVAHDIRSPMTAISLALGTLRDLPPPTRDLFEQSLKRMETIASDILIENTNSQADKHHDAKTLRQACAHLIREKESEHAHRKVRWHLIAEPLDAEQISVPLNPLMRTLSNLLNNSAEASPRDADVKLALESDAKTMRLRIVDRGPGIPAEVLERAIRGGYSTKPMGNGLGLSSAKELADRYDGQLACQHTAEGFEVSLTFPLNRGA